jgi:hypothetical protein
MRLRKSHPSSAKGGPGRGSIDRGQFPERWDLDAPKNNSMIASYQLGASQILSLRLFCNYRAYNQCDWSSSAWGHKRCPPLTASCQLLPAAADMPSDEAIGAKCHGTKSLRDSGGMWLVRSVLRTVEIVGNRRCLEDRGILDLQRDAQLDR